MKTLMHLFIKYKSILLICLTVFIAGFALIHPGLPPTHDGEYHVVRFAEFDKTLRGGDWYPRWAPDLNFGYGVPLFTYVYPLPNYTASLFHLLGLSFIDSFKAIMLVSLLLGGIFMYLWTKEFWGERGALLSSVLFTFSPYHFLDIYIRGSVGEALALGIFPAFLWAYTVFTKTSDRKFFGLSIVFLALTIFSHNILGLMFFTFAIIYMLILSLLYNKAITHAVASLGILLFSLGITTIFWVPALLEEGWVRGLQIFDIRHNFPDLFQLIFPSWGSGFSDSDLTNQMSFQVGVANFLFVFASIPVAFSLWKKSKNLSLLIAANLLAFFFTIYLMLPLSWSIWQKITLMQFFQFPWRLLSIEIILTAFLAGSLFFTKRSIFWLLSSLLLPILFTFSYAHPAYYLLRNDSYYLTRSNFIDSTNSPGNTFNTLWWKDIVQRSPAKALIIKGQGDISAREILPTSQQFAVRAHTPLIITFATAYMPGWKVLASGKVLSVRPDKKGLIQTSAPQGTYILSLQLFSTPLQQAATAISLVTLFLLVLLSLKIVRKSSR